MSTEHFNGLTPAEAERLALLAEECGEVIVAIMKIKRHGYESTNPTVPASERVTNRAALQTEVGQIKAAVRLLIEAGDLDSDAIEHAAAEKRRTVQRWLHHQTARSAEGSQT